MRYLLNRDFRLLTEKDQATPEDDILELLTMEDGQKFCRSNAHSKVLCRLLHDTINCCKVEILSDAIAGTLLIPDKHAPLTASISLVFYLENKRLVIFDEEQHLDFIRSCFTKELAESPKNIHSFFFELLETLIDGDMVFLQHYEHRMATMEESISNLLPKELQTNIRTDRRELLLFHSYYQQLLDMFEILAEDINNFFPEEFHLQFERLAHRVDRLYDHTQMLREYAHQIREMHQAEIDIRQNDTMRILTVVTTLFFPLSLLTGWYGMNFKHMPELQQPYAYMILIFICVILVIGEIWYFKKKGWL